MSAQRMSRNLMLITALVGGSVACSADRPGNPAAPAATRDVSVSVETDPHAVGASHALDFTAVVGEGSGTLNITASRSPGEFTLNANATVNVHGVPPNTVLFLRRSGDIALPGNQQADGICQRAAMGLFGAVPAHFGGPPVVLETSPGGAGALKFDLEGSDPFLPDGASVDVVYRLVDALPPAVPTIDLRTPCFTFTAR